MMSLLQKTPTAICTFFWCFSLTGSSSLGIATIGSVTVPFPLALEISTSLMVKMRLMAALGREYESRMDAQFSAASRTVTKNLLYQSECGTRVKEPEKRSKLVGHINFFRVHDVWLQR